MSKVVRGIVGAIAVTGVLGAAQFAFGGDLSQVTQSNAAPQNAARQDVNRAAKADRTELARPTGSGHTISVNLIGQSVLVRISDGADNAAERAGQPVAQERVQERAQEGVPALVKPAALQRRPTVACEPVVSVLTEVAKQLQPGRCVT